MYGFSLEAKFNTSASRDSGKAKLNPSEEAWEEALLIFFGECSSSFSSDDVEKTFVGSNRSRV